ncbi:hypothetical protein L6R49_23675 [Myxococcota bacterium]|nr:hypothetical protein [Myxococcota bacterium]
MISEADPPAAIVSPESTALAADLSNDGPAPQLDTRAPPECPPVLDAALLEQLRLAISRIELRELDRDEERRLLECRIEQIQLDVQALPRLVSRELAQAATPFVSKIERVEEMLRSHTFVATQSVDKILPALQRLQENNESRLNPILSFLSNFARNDDELRRIQHENQTLRGRERELDNAVRRLSGERDQLAGAYNELKHSYQRLEREAEARKVQYNRVLAAAAPQEGAVAAYSDRPSPDLIYTRLETLEHGNWRAGIEEVCRCTGAPVPFETRAWVSYFMCFTLFGEGRVEQLAEELRRAAGLVLDAQALERLEDLAGEVRQIVKDIHRSSPTSSLILPDDHEWKGRPFDSSRYRAHMKSDDAPDARMKYLLFPGYRTGQRVLLQPHMLNAMCSPEDRNGRP